MRIAVTWFTLIVFRQGVSEPACCHFPVAQKSTVAIQNNFKMALLVMMELDTICWLSISVIRASH